MLTRQNAICLIHIIHKIQHRNHILPFSADVAINQESEYTRSVSGSSLSETQSNTSASSPVRPKGLFREFLFDANPINGNEWREANGMVKALLVLRAPFMVVLQLFVPVVNETAEKRGWSKLLNCIQLWLTPVVALCVLEC